MKGYRRQIPLEDGESLFGFIHRLRVKNRHPVFRWIATDIGLARSATILTRENLERLALISGVDVGALEKRQATDHQPKSPRMLFGDLFAPRMVEARHSRICVDCFKSTGVHQLIWQLKAVTHCPRHGRALIVACESCRELLQWDRNDFRSCQCGYPLSRMLANNAQLNSDETAGIAAICSHPAIDSIGGRIQRECIVYHGLGLADYIRFLMLLGQITTYNAKEYRMPPLFQNFAADGSLLLTRGLHYSQNWPDAFKSYLEKRRSASPGKLLEAELQLWLYRHFYRSSSRASDLIRNVIHEFASDLGMFDQFGEASLPVHPDLISYREAKSRTGFPNYRITWLAKRFGWRDPAAANGPYASWYRRELVDDYMRAVATARRRLRPQDAGKRLGIAAKDMPSVFLEGLFGEYAKRRFPLRAGSWFLYRDEEDDLLARLSAVAGSLDDGRNGPPLDWTALRGHPRLKNISVGRLLRAICEGSLKSFGFCNKLTSLNFKAADVDAFVELYDLRADGGEYLSPEEAAAGIGVSPTILRRACTLDLISSYLLPSGARLIGAKALDCFLRDYTCAALLAARYSIPARAAANIFRLNGILPIGGNDGPDPNWRIYRVRDLASPAALSTISYLVKKYEAG